MPLTVIGPDTLEALAWLRRRQCWEGRMVDLHTPRAEIDDDVDRPTTAA